MTPANTVWSAPASAVGTPLSWTVTVTASGSEANPPASVTVSRKERVSEPVTVGAVKVGEAAVALLSVTVVPAV